MNWTWPLRWLRSAKFFYVIVGLLAVQSSWIALTARYPQAFDENFHFGLIQLHAHQWLPWFSHQPPGTAVYGAVAREPSYLYHYLLSFPYRLLTYFTSSQAVQVIVLRFINIGLFAAGLFAYRRLLEVLGASRAMVNAVLLFLVLTPVVPLLAAQINYDNLMFPLAGLLLLLMVRYYQMLHDEHELPLLVGLKILAVGGFGSIVTFPFAAIFAPAVIILAWLTWRYRAFRFRLGEHWRQAGNVRRALYGLLALVALLLCFERYGLNVVKYHAPVPKCHKVLSIDDCENYAPWARDYLFAATYPRPTPKGILVYPAVWAHRMVYETMFTITSTFWEDRASNQTIVYYYPADPLPLADDTAWVVLVLGTAAAIYFWRRWWQQVPLRLLLLVTAAYAIVLLIQNFAMYLQTGEAVAVHGRYMVPFFALLYLLLAWSLGWALEKFGLERYRQWLFLLVLVLFLQGAGVITWITRGEYWWYWPGSRLAQHANWLAQDVLHRIILR